jgi:diguanylate cyclase (GGDEF)-like protein/PAS domain S-box-containing protein
MPDRPQHISTFRKAFQVALVYFVVAGLWISLSDTLLEKWLSNPMEISRYQTLKGWGFVVVTALALLWITLHYMLIQERQVQRYQEQRAELRLLNQFWASVVDNASVWINVLDTSARVTVWNKAAEQISEYTRDEVLGNAEIWQWIYPDPEYRECITRDANEILNQGKEVAGYETRIHTKSGQQKIIAWNSRRFFDEEGNIVGSIAIGRDITAHKQTEEALVERERQLATLMSNLPGMAYRCQDDENWTMQFVSNGCSQLIGYSSDALVNNREISYASIVHEDDLPLLSEEIRRAVSEKRPFAVEYRIHRQDGSEIWVWEQGQGVTVDGKQYLEGIVMDISQRKAMEQELAILASRDTLTDLYNRRKMEQQFREELNRACRYQRPLSLLWIDVDHFKSVNDLFGHQAGDEVLKKLGQLLVSGIRSVDYAARYGGEELAVILPEMDETSAMDMAERLRSLVEKTAFVIDDALEVTITISVGVASYPTHGATQDALLRAADHAMYRAKENGRNRVYMSS